MNLCVIEESLGILWLLRDSRRRIAVETMIKYEESSSRTAENLWIVKHQRFFKSNSLKAVNRTKFQRWWELFYRVLLGRIVFKGTPAEKLLLWMGSKMKVSNWIVLINISSNVLNWFRFVSIVMEKKRLDLEEREKDSSSLTFFLKSIFPSLVQLQRDFNRT